MCMRSCFTLATHFQLFEPRRDSKISTVESAPTFFASAFFGVAWLLMKKVSFSLSCGSIQASRACRCSLARCEGRLLISTSSTLPLLVL